MTSMPIRELPNRHCFDRDPTPEHPAVRVYPEITWCGTRECWVRDDGQDTMGLNMIGPVNRAAASHRIDDDELTVGNCDTCGAAAYAWDDFFGYLCPLHEIKLRLRYKQRGVNPWGGKH